MSQPYVPTGPSPGTPGGAQRKTTIVLAILVTVLVLAAGLFVALFLIEKGAVADTNSQVSSTEQQITDQKKKLSDTKTEVDDLEAKGQELQSDHDKLQACADSAKKALQAGQTGTEQELSDAVDQMLTDCVR